jgi:hypothetical protein
MEVQLLPDPRTERKAIMDTIHLPDEVPNEPGVYRLATADDVPLAIVTISDLGDVSIDDQSHLFAPPRPAGRAFADALGVPIVKRMRTGSRRTDRRIAHLVDRGYSIARVYHVPGQRHATWSFVKVSR